MIFSHYEHMVVAGRKEDSGVKEQKGRDRLEVYWCKSYQKNNCKEKAPHFMQLKPDEPAVLVVHECAACWQREGRREEHLENESPKK